MRYVSCILLSTSITSDSIGVEKETTTQVEVPLTKVEDVYANEFYEANEQGFKPEIRLRLSAYNYNGEQELIYGDIHYTVIRTQYPKADEVVLICERKVKNVTERRGRSV